MDDDEDVLELGSRREPRPALTRVLIAFALVGAIGGYFLAHNRGDHSEHRAAPNPSSSSPIPFVPLPVPTPTPAARPPWPQVSGACGHDAFVPIVSAKPLTQRTGVRVVIGDRLSTVDVDRATVTPRSGLPVGVYATEIATAASGTYASLIRCRHDTVTITKIVRLDAHGALRTVASGAYADLLSGGDHPWGVIYHDDGSTTLDALDGHPQLPLASDFEPVAGFGNLIVGAAIVHSHASTDGPQEVQVIDPTDGRVVKALGESSSMVVSRGVVLWTGYRCPDGRCPLFAYDLAREQRLNVSASLPKDSGLFSAVLSPDRRSLAYVREQSQPSRYDPGHPGNPNEVAVANLVTGRTVVVPHIDIWSKSTPGLAFSAGSRWLVMSFDGGSRVRLLLWRPGLTSPLEPSVPLAGKVAFEPVVSALA